MLGPATAADFADLDPPVRARLAEIWTQRSAAEAGVAVYVRAVGEDLAGAGAHPSVLSMAAQLREDEQVHARMCLEVAERYASHTLEKPNPVRAEFRPLDGVPQPMRATLRVVGMNCIGETLAAAWMEASLRATQAPWLRTWVHRHFGDEVRHAQLGWAHLGTANVTPSMRAQIGVWVAPLLRANLASWLSEVNSDGASSLGHADHGILPYSETARIVREAIEEMILPGFERVGVDTKAVWAALPGLLRRSAVAQGEAPT
jgi:hypothetical protein